MKCIQCGTTLKSRRENYRYIESGLPGVTLDDVEVRRCENCGESEVVIENLAMLHRALARATAKKSSRLAPEELRFLRTYLGYSGVDFAKFISSTPETVSRWENGKTPVNPLAELIVRWAVLYLTPLTAYPPEDGDEVKDIMVRISEEATPLRLHIKRSKKKGWKPVEAGA